MTEKSPRKPTTQALASRLFTELARHDARIVVGRAKLAADEKARAELLAAAPADVRKMAEAMRSATLVTNAVEPRERAGRGQE